MNFYNSRRVTDDPYDLVERGSLGNIQFGGAEEVVNFAMYPHKAAEGWERRDNRPQYGQPAPPKHSLPGCPMEG